MSHAQTPRYRRERIRLRMLQAAYLAALVFCSYLTIVSIQARYSNLQTISPAGETGIGDLDPEDALALETSGITVSFYATYFTILEIGIAALFIGVSVLIFVAQHSSPMAVYAALTLAFFGINVTPVLDALMLAGAEWWLPAITARAIGLTLMILFFFVFPSGHFIPGWTRWAALIWVAYNLIWPFFESLAPPVRMIYKTGAQQIGFAWLFLWLFGGIAAQVYRFRRVSNVVERQQTHWVVFGMVTLFSLSLLGTALVYPTQLFETDPEVRVRLEMIGFTLVLVSQIFLALTFAIAILRYRLFDINLVIRRTLTYSLLVGMLVGIYAIGMIVLLPVFARATGQEDSPLAVVLSTLLTVALFNHLLLWIKTGIDRRFNRRGYNLEKTLEHFASQARDEVDLDRLVQMFLHSAGEALQPEFMQMWLNREERKTR